MIRLFARIKAYRAHREALRRLEDDVAVRKMLVGVDFAKRRAAQLNAASRRTYADGIDGWFARGGK